MLGARGYFMWQTKVCSKCGIEKPIDCFPFVKEKRAKNGYYKCYCKSCKKDYAHDYFIKNKDKVVKSVTKWQKKNKSKVRKYKKKAYANGGKEKILQRNRERYDFSYAIRVRMRRAITQQRGIKCQSSLLLLGCSIAECRKYIENKFLPGMTWENYGDWHIDHIQPCASFDLTLPEEQKKCFHYTNLQPLWEFDNLSKGAKIEVFTSEGIFFLSH